MPATPSASPDAGIAMLYRDHHSWLHGWLRLKLGDAHRAADLAQDTFVRLLSANSTSPSDTALREPRAYLRTIANRLLVDHGGGWRSSAVIWRCCRRIRRAIGPRKSRGC
ncbi:sigma factor [Achromobacter marplatensis]|uniref:RNA polymerase sigma-70 region 2 domain-containing protein n=1 Tax=Achromobacter marplatensis TaxID=470868 RepID=A0AA42WA93_9BURK|nr:sigma factor [Achromobacter marplatensis]MDH2051580.1 hypothetical protein [Achromobacter marplatensis]